jgi:4-oxalocrotonate tautomerase
MEPVRERSMPFVSIKFVRENIVADPEGKKARIADRVAQAVSDEMGVAKHDVWVVFEEIAARDFYLGADSVEAIRAKKK